MQTGLSCQRGSSTVSVRTTTSARTRTLVWARRLCVGLPPAAVGHARINLRDRGSHSLNPPCSHATLKTTSAFCCQATRVQTTGSAAPFFPKWRRTRRRHGSQSILFSTHSRRACPSSYARARSVQLARPTRRPLAITLSNGSASLTPCVLIQRACPGLF